jgi:RNA polymerase sigma-70 factor (ECF subfamily)
MVFLRPKFKTRLLVMIYASGHSGSMRFFILSTYRFLKLKSGRSPPSVLSIRCFLKIERMVFMITINLKELYPYYYKEDKFIDVPDELAIIFEEYAKAEETYERTRRRYKATYSLDREDGIERDILFVSLSPHELYERKLTQEQLYSAIASLPDKQAKRIYAHFFLGMSKAAIARSEGVSKVSVSESIERGLCAIEKFLKKFL